MSVRDKTRKKLWAKSGNRCAICKHELVGYQSEHATEVIIVEECHLVSPRPLRPRYDPELMIGYDDYNNLILLCRNHHKIIDEQVEIYTAGRLLY
jgi:predicted restriction endonuclease